MNEILKKIVYCLFAIYFLVSLIGGCVLKSRLERTRSELKSVRTELGAARNRQLELESTIADCAVIVNRDKQILSESGTSIQFIRAQISAIREGYQAMEILLRDSIHSRDNRGGNFTFALNNKEGE